MKLLRHNPGVVAVACLLLNSATADDLGFTVNVVPFMSLEAMRGPTFATHPMTPANVVLANSRWRARSSSPTGSTVTFETNHSFWNASDSSFKRDAILRLTQLQGPPTGGWSITVAEDQTNYISGDETATVSMT